MRISYGKLRVPVHRIDGDEVLACEVSVEVLGENFLPAYTDGDNANVVATDTMKNFILRESLTYDGTDLEGLLLHLGNRFISTYPVMEAVRMSAKELRFDRLGERVYSRSADDYGVAAVEPDGTVRGGRHGMMLLKTRGSAFTKFARDEYTTLPETADRILATSVTASWMYRPGTTDFAARDRIRAALVETFAAHDSRSVQHTLYAMAEAAIGACADVDEITLTLPNRHHLLVDLTPFGLDNANEVFLATDQPFGLIEATIRRKKGKV